MKSCHPPTPALNQLSIGGDHMGLGQDHALHDGEGDVSRVELYLKIKFEY